MGGGEGGVGLGFIALLHLEADVVRAIVPNRCAVLGQGIWDLDDRWQFFVVDLYQLCGITGLAAGLRHDEGDVISDECDLFLHQGGPLWLIHRRAVGPFER